MVCGTFAFSLDNDNNCCLGFSLDPHMSLVHALAGVFDQDFVAIWIHIGLSSRLSL